MKIQTLLWWPLAAITLTACLPAAHSQTNSRLLDQAQSLTADRHVGTVYIATVESVHDGDTIRARDVQGRSHRIRLAYIDAPELQQAHGQAARDALRSRILYRQITVHVFGRDNYQREVGKIIFDQQDINLAAIQDGHAWHYASIARREQNPAEFQIYATAQAQARRQQNGLWKKYQPIPPWQYRHTTRSKPYR